MQSTIKKAATPKSAAQSKTPTPKFTDTCLRAQRDRILIGLRMRGSLSTLEARSEFDVMHPAARVMELREEGYQIHTVWTRGTTPEGFQHRVARYHYIGEPEFPEFMAPKRTPGGQ